MTSKELGPYEEVELRLVEGGTDLWAVVEAAQYARTVTFDDPETEDETAAMTQFVRAFTASAEGWEEVPATAKAATLDGFGRLLGELREAGLFVHCGTVEREFAVEGYTPCALPVGIINLGRRGSRALTIMLPAAMDVST